MDCGPAVLKAALAGFGIRVSYGRLREACQTDVDGTSIDTLEEVAQRLGLDAEQVMLPLDHLFLAESDALNQGLAEAGRKHAAHVDTVDVIAGHAGALDRRFHRSRAKVCRRHVGKRALHRPHRGAGD